MSMGETPPKNPNFWDPATGMGQSRDSATPGATPMAAPTSLLRLNLLFCLLQDAFDGVVGAGLRCPDPRRDAT